MNAVVDEDLSRSFARLLSEKGFHVFDVRDVGLRGADDETVFRFAQEKHAILFTADLGFSGIFLTSSPTPCGLVLLRFPNTMSTEQMNEHISLLLDRLSENDYQGALVVLSPGNVRIRPYRAIH